MWTCTLSTVLGWYVEKKQEVLPSMQGDVESISCHQLQLQVMRVCYPSINLYSKNHAQHVTLEQPLRVLIVIK